MILTHNNTTKKLAKTSVWKIIIISVGISTAFLGMSLLLATESKGGHKEHKREIKKPGSDINNRTY
jgi:hypothetical protein